MAASSVKSSDGDGEDQDLDMDTDSGVANDALKEIEQFDQLELQHDVAFSVQKRLSCFNHTLQLVVRHSVIKTCSTVSSQVGQEIFQICESHREIDFIVWPQGYQRLSYPMEFNIHNDFPFTRNTTPHHSSFSGTRLGWHIQQ